MRCDAGVLIAAAKSCNPAWVPGNVTNIELDRNSSLEEVEAALRRIAAPGQDVVRRSRVVLFGKKGNQVRVNVRRRKTGSRIVLNVNVPASLYALVLLGPILMLIAVVWYSRARKGLMTQVGSQLPLALSNQLGPRQHCPHCRQPVVPLRLPTGPICPACNNTGNLAKGLTTAQYSRRSIIAASSIVVVLGVIYAFAFAGSLGPQAIVRNEKETIEDGFALTQAFYVSRTQTIHFEVSSDAPVYAALVPVADLNNPEPRGDAWWAEQQGTLLEGDHKVSRGKYGLYIECGGPGTCHVTYSIIAST